MNTTAKTMRYFSAIALFGLTGLCSNAFAQDDIKVSGQIRERSTYTNKGGFANEFGEGNDSHELRSRIAVDAKTSDLVSVRVEIQDSRNFGTEPNNGVPHTSTIGASKSVDLHQAYFVLGTADFSMKMGRQKVALGSQRMVSSLEWHPNARVFDGVKFDKKVGEGSLSAMAFLTNDSGKEDYTSLSGVFFTNKFGMGDYDVYAFYDKNTQPAAGIKNWDLVYLGERVKVGFGDAFFEEEVIYQAGDAFIGSEEVTSSAFYLALSLGYKMDKNVFTLGFDMMSGDDDPTDDTFSTYMNNYTFAHAYFGWMDYFVVNKAATGGAGVSDIHADAALAVGDHTLKVAGHYFMPAAGDGDPYGIELNAELHAKLFPKTNIVFGAGAFLPNSDRYEDGKAEFAFYFMPIINF